MTKTQSLQSSDMNQQVTTKCQSSDDCDKERVLDLCDPRGPGRPLGAWAGWRHLQRPCDVWGRDGQ